MSRGDAQRLADILEAIEEIRGHRSSEDAKPSVVRDAVLYRLVVIGEAAGRLSDATQAGSPEIEWRAIVALRNRLAHAYWSVSLELIDEIIENELRPLEDAARRLLAGEGR
jgi:uncharacterized protein with HEPN domain